MRDRRPLIPANLVPRDGKEHHISGVWDGTTYRIYVDGVEVADDGSGA